MRRPHLPPEEILLHPGRRLSVDQKMDDRASVEDIIVRDHLDFEKGRSLAGYRNRLVHEYAAVDTDEMWD